MKQLKCKLLVRNVCMFVHARPETTTTTTTTTYTGALLLYARR